MHDPGTAHRILPPAVEGKPNKKGPPDFIERSSHSGGGQEEWVSPPLVGWPQCSYPRPSPPSQPLPRRSPEGTHPAW